MRIEQSCKLKFVAALFVGRYPAALSEFVYFYIEKIHILVMLWYYA